jgi:hypothetical protein
METRLRTRGFLLGLLADLPRKNCWTIAEHAGDSDPHGMQHLLGRASWPVGWWKPMASTGSCRRLSTVTATLPEAAPWS